MTTAGREKTAPEREEEEEEEAEEIDEEEEDELMQSASTSFGCRRRISSFILQIDRSLEALQRLSDASTELVKKRRKSRRGGGGK